MADYRHVPAGPGVLLVGHEANYSLDNTFDRLGLLYNRKSVVNGTPQDRLLQSFYAALRACRRLEAEPGFEGKLKFDPGDCEVIFNDRLLSPNTEETWNSLRPELEKFFDRIYGSGAYQLQRAGEPRERFRVSVKSAHPVLPFD